MLNKPNKITYRIATVVPFTDVSSVFNNQWLGFGGDKASSIDCISSVSRSSTLRACSAGSPGQFVFSKKAIWFWFLKNLGDTTDESRFVSLLVCPFSRSNKNNSYSNRNCPVTPPIPSCMQSYFHPVNNGKSRYP